jgi:ribokinase
MQPLNVNVKECRYQAMIGVGGIGSGMFFRLDGDHTLGREESRSGYFLDRKDYCKLHIISHYVQILLGKDFQVFPVGKLGEDEVGQRLLEEMRETGFQMEYVQQSPGEQTLFSFCFIYPDGSGGNITTSDSACSKVNASFVQVAEQQFRQFSGKGISLAAPEVPLEARARLLELGTKYKFLRVASFTSGEISAANQAGLLQQVDLLGINLDEAAALAGMSIMDHTPKSIVDNVIKAVYEMNPRMIVSITRGKDGSWCWDGAALNHFPVFPVKVQNTAGAGDAHLAGLMVGLTAGLSVAEAQQLATLISGSSVESPHTINKQTDCEALRIIAEQSKSNINKNVLKLLED